MNWLNKKNNRKVILFFNGWGMDKNAVKHMHPGNYDLYMFNNYHPQSSVDIDFKEYEEVYLVAWSLGVWASSHVLSENNLEIKKAIAINGMLNPVNQTKGIPPKLLKLTLDNWNNKNRESFDKNIFGEEYSNKLIDEYRSKRETENQKQELGFIFNHIQSAQSKRICFDCAVIGRRDKIFSYENQLTFWESESRCVALDIPHFPFLKFKTWQEILEL